MNQVDVYVKLAERAGFPQSRFIREVYKKLVTPEEGEMLLALPATPEEVAEKSRMDEATVKQKLDEFARKGVAIPREKEGVLRYFNPTHPIMLHDATTYATLYKKYEPVQDEVLELWRRFRETEWFELARLIEEAGMTMARVVPSRGAIEDTSSMLAYEDLGAIIEEAPGIVVIECACRWLRAQEGECNKPYDVCFYFTPFTLKHLVDNGTGRKISVDEAYEICDIAAEAGLCPTVSGGVPVPNICFCCSDCCILLRPVIEYGYNTLEKSRYQTAVDKDLCNGCQVCVDRCQFNAIEMVKVPRSRKLKAAIDPEKCYGCGVCVVKCPTRALTLKVARPVEHIPVPAGLVGMTALDTP